MMLNVLAALRLFGGLKFGTPLETASTPVSAVQPWENARSTIASASSPVALCWAAIWKPADSATGACPDSPRTSAHASIANTITMKP